MITCHPERGGKGIDDVGVLSRFHGVAVHDAWAPYDTYTGVEYQLCCAHALRELQAVVDTAPPDAGWYWTRRTADALVAMQKLVTEAITTGRGSVDADVLDKLTRLYRSAVQIGIASTAARSDKVMRNHNALPAGWQTGKTTTSVSPPTGEYPRQQRRRAGHPHDQVEAEGVRLPAQPHRSPTVLRGP